MYGCLPGQGAARPLVFSAHLDTVFPKSVDLRLVRDADRITGPGIGDNALGVAGLISLAELLRRRPPLAGNLWFVANVAEEGLGNLRGMQAVVDRFKDDVSAYIVLEGTALGRVYHRGLGVQRYRITVRTAGGHSWVNYGQPSAIHEMARLVVSLVDIPLPSQPRTTLNVCVISGGTSINTIASEASLELDLRSEDEQVLAQLARQVEKIAWDAAHSEDKNFVQVSSERIGHRPVGSIPAAHPLVQLAKRCQESQGVNVSLGIGSTDANLPLSLGLPAICIGITTGGGAHTLQEYIHTTPVCQGLAALVSLIEPLFR